MNEKLKTYNSAFKETFGIDDSKLPDLKYQDIIEWDSVGHMGLMGIIRRCI